MSRFLLLAVLLVWMLWVPDESGVRGVNVALGAAVFTGFYVFLVVVLRGWAMLLARRVGAGNHQSNLRRFNLLMQFARWAVPVWFAVGVYVLGWGHLIEAALRPLDNWQLELPAILVGCLPPFLAWMGLWWSQYPADTALREQSLLDELDQGLPIHAPPTFKTYFGINLRLQILFTIAPILVLIGLKDLIALAMWALPILRPHETVVQAAVSFPSALLVFIFAPEILKRVLHTEPLPPGPLRRRLENLAARNGVRCRDVLLWRTHYYMGNALVMGLFPQVRYILLSDLLLETMTDAEIEAVFAHELGHVRHRHMYWFLSFFALLITGSLMFDAAMARLPIGGWPVGLATGVLGAGVFFLAFGYLSRKFERQADVFAARTLQSGWGDAATGADRPTLLVDVPATAGIVAATGAGGLAAVMLRGSPSAAPALADAAADESHVGRYGATVFASALERVARVNNIPIRKWEWLHGSIDKRIRYLHELSHDPARTGEFDRFMRRLYTALLLALCLTSAWAGVTLWLARGAML